MINCIIINDNDRGDHHSCFPSWLSNYPYHHNLDQYQHRQGHHDDQDYHNCQNYHNWQNYYNRHNHHDRHDYDQGDDQNCIPTWLPASAVGLATTGTSWVSLRDIIGNDHFSHGKLFISSNGDESG